MKFVVQRPGEVTKSKKRGLDGSAKEASESTAAVAVKGQAPSKTGAAGFVSRLEASLMAGGSCETGSLVLKTPKDCRHLIK